jgi:uncharacterized protein (DUF1778 family)
VWHFAAQYDIILVWNMAKTQSIEARIDFRISPEAKAQIERAAAAMGRSLTDFAKEALTQKAKAVLDEREVVQLSDRDRDIFLQLLDADPAPNAALEAAIEHHRRLIVR